MAVFNWMSVVRCRRNAHTLTHTDTPTAWDLSSYVLCSLSHLRIEWTIRMCVLRIKGFSLSVITTLHVLFIFYFFIFSPSWVATTENTKRTLIELYSTVRHIQLCTRIRLIQSSSDGYKFTRKELSVCTRRRTDRSKTYTRWMITDTVGTCQR